MREYLFRGKKWDNSGWVYGDLIQGGEDGSKWILPIEELKLTQVIKIIPETVGQLLKRYNGVDFYEGDICRTKDEESLTLILCWIESNCMCAWLTKEEYDANKCDALEFDEILFWTYSFDDEAAKSIDIIGNIYDNPELLQSL